MKLSQFLLVIEHVFDANDCYLLLINSLAVS